MEDINSKLSSILSDPEAMKEISALASQLGINSPGLHNEPPKPSPQPKTRADFSPLSALGGLMPMLGSLKADDDTTRLLEAIRPFLGEERRKKLDKAKKLIQVMRLLPMLRELDIFDL